MTSKENSTLATIDFQRKGVDLTADKFITVEKPSEGKTIFSRITAVNGKGRLVFHAR